MPIEAPRTDSSTQLPGDFRRNSQGRPWVSNPNGTGRDLLYHRPSSLWPFDDWTGVDEIYSRRGTHVHTLCDHADRAEPLTDDFLAAGVELGITAELQAYIYARWVVFRKAFGLTAAHIEQPVVNDAWKVAGTCDRVDSHGPDVFVGDIKTGSNPVKASYLVQLAAYADAVPYTPDAGDRGGWNHMPNPDTAYIYWFPLTAAIKAEDRTGWPDWSLVAVDLAAGRRIGQALVDMRDDKTYKDSFGEPQAPPDDTIAAPSSPSEVEPPAGGDVTHGSESSPPATIDEARRRQLLGRYNALSSEQLQNIVMPDDKTDLDAIEAAIHAVNRFVPDVAPRATKVVDEGADIDEATVAAAGKRYAALPDKVRTWVTVSGAKVRLSAKHGGRPTVRRMELLRGLCELAEAGYNDDDMARAVAEHVIGDAAWQGSTVADMLASLDITEATRWAQLCDVLTSTANVALHWDLDGRAHVTPSIVETA